jgi:transposase
MRYSQTEKMEIIRLVESSELSVKKTLRELCVNRSTFYDWYRRYLEDGYDGLSNRKPMAGKFWNKIPETFKDQVVDFALDYPEMSPRELAWHITDNEGYFISESSVYRILKACDLITISQTREKISSFIWSRRLARLSSHETPLPYSWFKKDWLWWGITTV